MAFAMVKFVVVNVVLIILFVSPYTCLCRCPPQEYEALLSFNISTSTDHDGDIPWANGTDCCQWEGIVCDQQKSHVVEITWSSNYKGTIIPDNLCKLPLLRMIDISSAGITGTLPSCLGNLHYLHELTIEDNRLGGVIPLSICMLKNLTRLSLRGNQLNGSLPSCLNNISSLRYLELAGIQLSGQIPYTWGDHPVLEVLDVSFNQLSGNRFNESILPWALPSSLRSLHLSLNHELTISETFFHNLTNLQYLSLSNCTLNISTSWIPKFQLDVLELVSCQMDGQIPPWVSTQFSLKSLTLSNNGLYGEIPSWLWTTSLRILNLSRNHLHGPLLPNVFKSHMSLLDVSHNALSGWIPSVLPLATINYGAFSSFMFNDNLFTGNIPPSLCSSSVPVLKFNLENNKLVGSIPWCLIQDGSPFHDLNFGGNSLEGAIPQGLTVSPAITSLVLKNNQLSGTFFPSFEGNTTLQVLDIGHNKFTGHLPKSIGNISSLRVLVMKGNQFSGNIIPEIGELKQLQILDLSSNNLSGSIPLNIASLQAMAVAREEDYVQTEEVYTDSFSYTIDLGGLNMTTKGAELYYPYILSTLTAIDLSNNQLNGNVPLDFGKLKGLRYLNLSMNNLNGVIPHSFGNMSQLESLDLSSNKFSGNIPSELQSLNYLAYLNLSHNNLSGSIPQGGQMITFENTSYSGNQNLQGCPLPKNCSWPKFAAPPPVSAAQDKEEAESEQIPWYQIGVGWSYGAGFLIVVVILLSVRERWRKKYFKVVDNILKSLFPFLRNSRL